MLARVEIGAGMLVPFFLLPKVLNCKATQQCLDISLYNNMRKGLSAIYCNVYNCSQLLKKLVLIKRDKEIPI